MLIKFLNPEDCDRAYGELKNYAPKVRFTYSLETNTSRGGRKSLKVSNVRLKENKEYCGNHPARCEVLPGNKPRKANFLEGADWVGFNDMLNDILDVLSVEANVSSSACVIRRGRERRTAYYEGNREGVWDKEGEGCFYDCMGEKSEPSDYPSGTPGIASYCLE